MASEHYLYIITILSSAHRWIRFPEQPQLLPLSAMMSNGFPHTPTEVAPVSRPVYCSLL